MTGLFIIKKKIMLRDKQPHSGDIFINQKILPLGKLNNQQEGIIAYKLIDGTFLMNDFLIHGDVRHLGIMETPDCGVRGLGFKSPGSLLTSRTETTSLSRVVRDG